MKPSESSAETSSSAEARRQYPNLETIRIPREGSCMHKKFMTITKTGSVNLAWAKFLVSEGRKYTGRIKLQSHKRKLRFLQQRKNQCSHLKCVRTENCEIKWYGKLKDDANEYELDYDSYIRDAFKAYFVRQCRSNLGQYQSVPVGRSLHQNQGLKGNIINDGTIFYPPKDGMPIVKYQQHDTEGCMCCALASALEFFGDSEKGDEIYNMQKLEDGSMTKKLPGKIL